VNASGTGGANARSDSGSTRTEWDKMLDDPFLNYFALGLLIFVVVANSYLIIAILRKLIRRARHHPLSSDFKVPIKR
jgi:hypothetical protein